MRAANDLIFVTNTAAPGGGTLTGFTTSTLVLNNQLAVVAQMNVGGVDAPVLYAGWVTGTIAGLYQINAQLPVNAAAAFTNSAGQAAFFQFQPTLDNENNWQRLTNWTLPTLTVDQLLDVFDDQLLATVAALQNASTVFAGVATTARSRSTDFTTAGARLSGWTVM